VASSFRATNLRYTYWASKNVLLFSHIFRIATTSDNQVSFQASQILSRLAGLTLIKPETPGCVVYLAAGSYNSIPSRHSNDLCTAGPKSV